MSSKGTHHIMRMVDAQAVYDALPMQRCIELMRAAMTQFSKRACDNPPRTKVALGQPGNTLFLMPAGDNAIGVFGCKMIVQNLQNADRGLPSIHGQITLFKADTGQAIGVVDASAVTATRTAAMSGLATQLLAREDATTHGILGTGAQALPHAESVAAVRPIEQVLVWGRDSAKTAAVAENIRQQLALDARPVTEARRAAQCDIVSTITAAREPVLFGNDLMAGAHVNLVGSHSPECREIDTTGVRRANVFVDSQRSAREEAGDLIIPFEEDGKGDPGAYPEIGAVASGEKPGRVSAGEVTIFKSLGLAIQDLYAAHHVLNNAPQVQRR